LEQHTVVILNFYALQLILLSRVKEEASYMHVVNEKSISSLSEVFVNLESEEQSLAKEEELILIFAVTSAVGHY